MRLVEEPPKYINIEPVYGCERNCEICPNTGTNKKNVIKFMKLKLLSRIAWEIRLLTKEGRKLCINLSMRGEPLLHEKINSIIYTLRQYLPFAQISLYTSGVNLTPESSLKLFSEGLNYIYLNCYGASYYKHLITFDPKKMKFSVINIDEIEKNKYYGYRDRIMIFIFDQRSSVKLRKNLTSYCQVLSKLTCTLNGIKWYEEPLDNGCFLPFNSISIGYNGKILLCENDWLGLRMMYDISKIKSDLCEYWYNNETLNIIRTLLYYKIRNFSPCSKCDIMGENFPDFNYPIHSDILDKSLNFIDTERKIKRIFNNKI